MPSTVENERDNAGLAYGDLPRPRGILAKLGLGRTKPIAQGAPGDPSMAAVPLAPYQPGVGPQVGPLMPLASANVQLGRFLVPYGAPTMVHAYISGPQLFCGVEAVSRNYDTRMAAGNPRPFFQQTQRPTFPVVTTRDGGRPGNTLGPAGVATAYGKVRENRQDAAQGFAAKLLGW